MRLLVDQVALEQLAVLLAGVKAFHIGIDGRHVHRGGELKAYRQPISVLCQGTILHDEGCLGGLVTAAALSGDLVYQHMEVGVGGFGSFLPMLLDFDVQLGILQLLIVFAVIPVDLHGNTLLAIESNGQIDQPPPHRASHFSL